MSNQELELETFAGRTIQAWKDQATKAGLVLGAPADVTDFGDFPGQIYGSLRRFRRNIAITKNHKKIVTHMVRQLISQRDEKGPTKKEFLTFQGYYSGTTHKGEEHHADFEIGKYSEEIKYYFKSADKNEPLPRRDDTFSYDEFVNCTIEELRKLSFQGGGSKTPGIWRDNDGKLRDKFGQLLSPESGNKEAYQ